MSNAIVLGLGFGDEGKGRTTSYLSSLFSDPIICRFNGGHQAGHTVITDVGRHVFSSFGSGTLQGIPTYWSRFCTIFPRAIINERIVLEKLGVNPTLYVDPLCPVTTPFDIAKNHASESKNRHGSVGVGFGATIERHEKFYRLYAQDLFYPHILSKKLDCIIDHYQGLNDIDWSLEKAIFMDEAAQCIKYITLDDGYCLDTSDVIFEGAQGIMLDQDFGFFPHVTRSNTTSNNALILCAEHDLEEPNVYYVTRTYQTRHGNGPMSAESLKPSLCNNENETNITQKWQGNFRIGALDLGLLDYALACDSRVQLSHKMNLNANLVVTCIDQTSPTFTVVEPDQHINPKFNVQDLNALGQFNSVLHSMGAETNKIQKVN